MPAINFTHQYLWGTTANNSSNRPYSEVRITGTAGTVRLWSIMDTGADYMQFEPAVATAAGISTAAAAMTTIQGATGTASMPLVSAVSVEIEGNPVSVEALVGGSGRAVVGRRAIITAIEFGMDQHGWLYK